MPWRGPEYDGEFPSLGWGVSDWCFEHLVVPDGPFAGEPLEFTDEQLTLLVRWYQLDDRGRFVYRRGSKRAPQGAGKSPFLGAMSLAELAGPVRFGGWDANGEPVGVRMPHPWVQVAACSEDQTDNTFAAAYAMAVESDLADKVIDIGRTIMYLAGGEQGRLEPVTASAGSRLGQRLTYTVLDETHLWTQRNGGHKLAATLRRNASKMSGRTFESTNAFLVGEDSVAERTWQAAQKGAAGLLYEAFEAPPVEDLTDRNAVLEALRVAYGDAVRWVPIERIANEVSDPGVDPDDVRRFYLNQLTSGGLCPFALEVWDELAKPRDVPEGTRIALGFDGSISQDRTVLYGCVPGERPYVFQIRSWSRPANAPDWRVPRLEVHAAVRHAFARWRVGKFFCDPPKWESEVEGWQKEFGTPTDPLRVEPLDTNQARKFAPECERFATDIRERRLEHDGSADLRGSLSACAKKQVRLADNPDDGRTRFVIVKADTRKIDDAVGAILARAAAATMSTQPRARFVNLTQALCNHPMLNNGRCAQCGADVTEQGD
jgi:hypothetical protein